MTNYTRGAAYEYEVKRELEQQGCFVVRSAGSHGPVDLVALTPDGKVVLIQCKTRKPTAAEVADLDGLQRRFPWALCVMRYRLDRT